MMKSFWSRCKLRDQSLTLGEFCLSELLPVLKDIAERLRFFFPQISRAMSKKLSLESVKRGGTGKRGAMCS